MCRALASLWQWLIWQRGAKGADLTHWGRVTHTCVSKITTIGSDNDSSPGRRQAIIWTNARILLIERLGTNFSEILIEIYMFSLKKTHWKRENVAILSRPQCVTSMCFLSSRDTDIRDTDTDILPRGTQWSVYSTMPIAGFSWPRDAQTWGISSHGSDKFLTILSTFKTRWDKINIFTTLLDFSHQITD